MSIITEFANIFSSNSILAFSILWEFVVGHQDELFVFALAIFVHLILFAPPFSRTRLRAKRTSYEPNEQWIKLDDCTERCTSDTAIMCGQESTVAFPVEGSPVDVAKHIIMIRAYSAHNNLDSAFTLFEALRKNGSELNASIYNAVLHACVECHDLQRALKLMKEMWEAGKVDVVSYNTLIKAHASVGCFEDARALMHEMVKEGMKPNHITYNELISGYIRNCNVRKVWDVVEEMQAAGFTPNQVTCSILLKNLSQMSSKSDVIQLAGFIGKLEKHTVDEILLHAIAGACVRVAHPQVLMAKLVQLHGANMKEVHSADTFGSLMKAYGHVGDMKGAWKCWREMRSRRINPGSITIGCMVECVASNGDPDGAYELILGLLKDNDCCSDINAVIYGSVLKAFARENRMGHVWTIYKDMQRHGIDPIVTTYNLLCDACIRNGQMEGIPVLLSDMEKKGVPPNLITFTTLLKGHSQRGDMQAAFETLRQMRKATKFRPDERMYNTLLDGCATHGMVDAGKDLLHQMRKEGIKPSYYTLSISVRMLGNANQLDEAFELVVKATAIDGLEANAYVYSNLVQACIINKKISYALQVLEDMAKNKLQPNIRTYFTALRVCIDTGMHAQATTLARAAMGLPGHEPYPFRNPDMNPLAKPARLFDIVNELIKALAKHGQKELATSLFADIKRDLPQFRIYACTKRAVMDLQT